MKKTIMNTRYNTVWLNIQLSCLILLAFLSGNVIGRQATLSADAASTIAGSIHNPVSISLDCACPVAGILFELNFDPEILTPSGILPLNGMELWSGSDFSVPNDGRLIVALFDCEGAFLPAAAGEIAQILFTASPTAQAKQIPLTLEKVELADTLYQQIAVECKNGALNISGGEPLKPPVNLTARLNENNVILTWEAPLAKSTPDPDPIGIAATRLANASQNSQSVTTTGYNIYRSIEPDPAIRGERIGTVPAGELTYTDSPPLNLWNYQVTAVYETGESFPSDKVMQYVTSVEPQIGKHKITSFDLLPNFPNPFNPETEIRYSIAAGVFTTIRIYNLLGVEVRTLVNAFKQPGFYRVRWDGRDRNGYEVASGIYLYIMQAGEYTKIAKMLKIK
ncbi:T9SS type A sorting domain-containing protein [candidate division KSB1 bacterium]|nr:T9SS type A sorting domain-containing protein [candidate division KSB1 bacterium]